MKMNLNWYFLYLGEKNSLQTEFSKLLLSKSKEESFPSKLKILLLCPILFDIFSISKSLCTINSFELLEWDFFSKEYLL